MSLVTLAGDTESCCSKIQSLIELKLEAPNLSTDHRCHGAPEEELSQRACFTGLALSVFTFFYVQVHSHVLLFGLQIFSSLSLSGVERKNWSETEQLSNPYTVPLAISVLISDCEYFHHASFILNATKCSKWLNWNVMIANHVKYLLVMKFVRHFKNQSVYFILLPAVSADWGDECQWRACVSTLSLYQ